MDGNKMNGKSVTEANLVEKGYRKYEGKEITVYYNANVCQHVGNCVRENPAIYEVGRRPWIIADNTDVNENIRVVNACPSGALKYIVKDKN